MSLANIKINDQHVVVRFVNMKRLFSLIKVKLYINIADGLSITGKCHRKEGALGVEYICTV